MNKVKSYLSLIKFSHTVFAMPFALIGFCIPGIPLIRAIIHFQNQSGSTFDGYFGLTLQGNRVIEYSMNSPYTISEFIIRLLLVILCMVFARSAAMAFNRYLDRQYDAKNPRTAVREIPAGIITPKNALAFTIISSLLFIACTFFINRICFYLSPVALLVILGYSYTKRFTALCHLVLGVGLSLAPIGAYLAVTGVFHVLPVIFSVVVLFWVSGFDIIYALQDEEFDKSQQLNSIPAWLGKRKALRVSELLHLISAAAVFFAGWYGGFGWMYWVGAGLFTGMLIYQHSLVKPDDLRRVNIAFMTANGIASVVFAIFVIAELFVRK